ncbi:MAG: lasso peptide biosynthesis B2 protein, partial [Sphingomicrobium sp.]
AARSGEMDRKIRSIVMAARSVSLVTRAHDRCLVRGLAVHAACSAAGVRTSLVLGVIAHPFAAHCWVQLGDAVLVEGYEQARLFTPILVLE